MSSLIRAIKSLVELAAIRHTLPQSRVASESYARAWKLFVFRYQLVDCNAVTKVINRHGVIWAAQGRTGSIRRAKREAYELKLMAGLRAMNRAVAAMSVNT